MPLPKRPLWPLFDNSLHNFLLTRLTAIILLAFAVILATATLLYDRLIIRQAQDTAAGIAAQTYLTINALMPYGISREQLLTVIGQIKTAHATSPYRIKIYRSPLVDELYGPVEEKTPFTDTAHAIIGGYGRVAIQQEKELISHLYPLTIDDPACLSCHLNAEIGTVLGVVEVRQNLQVIAARMRSQYRWFFFLYGLAAAALVAMVASLVVKRVTAAVNDFQQKTAAINSVADLNLISGPPRSRHSFSELDQTFVAMSDLARRLQAVAVDKAVLEFEIKLMSKFIITSNVARDWQKFVKELLVDINSIIDTYTLFVCFQTTENGYELDAFWRSAPDDALKASLENLVQQQAGGGAPPTVRIVHHDSGSPMPLPKDLGPDDIELRTKSLFLDKPRMGGIVGIGVQSRAVMDPVYSLVLDSVLTTLLNMVGSVKAIYLYARELEHHAIRDPLTNLHNQRMFQELLHNELRRAERYDYAFGLLLIDLDDFKTVNARYGRAFGDLFLQQVAESLRQAARKSDLVARYGGDEFAVLLPKTDRETALAVANRIVEAVSALSVKTPEGLRVQTTVSGGLVCYPEHGANASDLFGVASNLMRQVKAEGKNAIAKPEAAGHRLKLTETDGA